MPLEQRPNDSGKSSLLIFPKGKYFGLEIVIENDGIAKEGFSTMEHIFEESHGAEKQALLYIICEDGGYNHLLLISIT